MALTQRPSSLVRQKEGLELSKLRTDILFVKLSFVAQIVNTLAIAALGVLVFVFVQRPQIEQAEATRLSNERQQVGLAIERAIGTTDSVQRNAMFEMLKVLWPQYSEIGLLERTQNLLQVTIPTAHTKDDCAKVKQSMAELEATRIVLQQQITDEINGRGQGPRGIGRIANTLQQQLKAIEQRISDTKLANAICLL